MLNAKDPAAKASIDFNMDVQYFYEDF